MYTKMRILWAAALAAVLCVGQAPKVSAVTSGFEEKDVLDGDTLGGGMVVDFEWTPEGQLIVIKKEGEIQVYNDPDGDNSYASKTVALDLAPILCANSERGVEGVEVHPDFVNNRYM